MYLLHSAYLMCDIMVIDCEARICEILQLRGSTIISIDVAARLITLSRNPTLFIHP